MSDPFFNGFGNAIGTSNDLPGLVISQTAHQQEIARMMRLYSEYGIALPAVHVADHRSTSHIPVLGEDGQEMTPERRAARVARLKALNLSPAEFCAAGDKDGIVEEELGSSAVRNRPGIRVIKPRPAVDVGSILVRLAGLNLRNPVQQYGPIKLNDIVIYINKAYDYIFELTTLEPLSISMPLRVYDYMCSQGCIVGAKFKDAILYIREQCNVVIYADVIPGVPDCAGRVHIIINILSCTKESLVQNNDS